VVVAGLAAALVAIGLVRYFVWLDLGSRCVIGLRPSLVGYDNRTVKLALSTLRHGSPDDYRKVCAHVASINPNPSCGGFGGGCFWHNEGNRDHRARDVSRHPVPRGTSARLRPRAGVRLDGYSQASGCSMRASVGEKLGTKAFVAARNIASAGRRVN
jgi:hypothetical protein